MATTLWVYILGRPISPRRRRRRRCVHEEIKIGDIATHEILRQQVHGRSPRSQWTILNPIRYINSSLLQIYTTRAAPILSASKRVHARAATVFVAAILTRCLSPYCLTAGSRPTIPVVEGLFNPRVHHPAPHVHLWSGDDGIWASFWRLSRTNITYMK